MQERSPFILVRFECPWPYVSCADEVSGPSIPPSKAFDEIQGVLRLADWGSKDYAKKFNRRRGHRCLGELYSGEEL